MIKELMVAWVGRGLVAWVSRGLVAWVSWCMVGRGLVGRGRGSVACSVTDLGIVVESCSLGAFDMEGLAADTGLAGLAVGIVFVVTSTLDEPVWVVVVLEESTGVAVAFAVTWVWKNDIKYCYNT
ncbi:unnamed protein product [Owenia fusiformis]|uniref:Transmembrane protein n=1 Tax=Owenia fusiformis TaxID=6347 RepID=A0A8S4P6L0_OWEFU|nr:unnamed protein product [Owenia fusiformis]